VGSTLPTTANFQAVIARRQNLSIGRLDLRVFVVDPGSDTPPDPSSPVLAAVGDAINRSFSDAGIQLGDVSFGVVPTDIEELTSVVDPTIDDNFNGTPDQVELLFAGTPRDASRALDLFVIQEFFGSPIIGRSGGIPGPAMAPTTRSSGVVVAAFDGLSGNPQDIDALAQTAAHEAAHYLGLFHTTEAPPNTAITDPIQDSPTCPATTFSGAPLSCPDAGNLMFPFQVNAQQTALTPGQAYVLQRHPLVRD